MEVLRRADLWWLGTGIVGAGGRTVQFGPLTALIEHTMIRIDCPWCGPRDETEFVYRGDATVRRQPAGACEAAFFEYIRARTNPHGWHVEWWRHTGGCRKELQVVRSTVTHEVRAVAPAAQSGPAGREAGGSKAGFHRDGDAGRKGV
jgi:sarcosine oxidase subunit delta